MGGSIPNVWTTYWENDLVGFRAYGPALQARGERGFGYDLFTKRGTAAPVLEDMYAKELDADSWKQVNELRKTDPKAPMSWYAHSPII